LVGLDLKNDESIGLIRIIFEDNKTYHSQWIQMPH